MSRSAARFVFFLLSTVLLTSLFLPGASAEGPVLTAKFGIAGHYRPGGWCLVTVSVTNPGEDALSGQLQVLTTGDTSRGPYGRRTSSSSGSVVFACSVSVPGGSPAPHTFPLYLRGIDPGQADLTVQLVEGRERGDGRVLASINNQSQTQNTSQTFIASPVAPGDTLLVGFGGDPGAFLFLNGLRVAGSAPPQTNPNNLNMPQSVPATVQVAEAATAADLPDKAAGYDGVSAFLLRSDAPIEGMTEAQTNALRGWVASGGHLIVCGGPDPTRFGASFFEGLLPATLGSSGASGSLALTPKPLPGVHVVQSSPNGPQIVAGPFGAGTVTLTASSPPGSAAQFQGLPIVPPLWQTLLSSQSPLTASALGMTAAREENYNAIYYGNSPPLLSEAVMRGPSLDAPGTSVIALFLLVYLIVLVPVNYFVLKRMDRKEWAWLTIPALVFLFAAGTFAVGYAAKGGSVFVNRAAIIETTAGRREAGVYSEIGLFSPHRTSYDVGLSGDNLVAAVPNPGTDYNSQNGSQSAGPVQFAETSSGVNLPSTPVNMWAMRAFDTQSSTDLGGTIDASLTDQSGRAAGTLVNHTTYALTDCVLYYGGGWIKLGDLASGATLPVSATGAIIGGSNGFPVQPPTGTPPSIQERMHAALGDYYRSLGQTGPNYNGGQQPPAYAPAPGEALLAGWSSDPKLAGPPPRIDGRSVTENDVNLVIVHLPISGPHSYSVVVPQTVPVSPFGFVSTQFVSIFTSSPSYKQALDTRRFPAAAALKHQGQAHTYRLRGIVSTIVHNSGTQGAILDFEPDVSQHGVVAVLPFSPGRRDKGVLGLLGREVVVNGTLIRAQGMMEIVVSQPGQLQQVVR